MIPYSSNNTVNLSFFHGNFQSPAVWSGIIKELHRDFASVRFHAADWTETEALTLSDAASRYCDVVRQTNESARNVLVGYSMGGRFALHLLLEDPSLWAGAIIVAADPGSELESERRSILNRDTTWAAKLRSGTLEDILAEWDRLPVFGGKPKVAPRSITDLESSRLAKSMVRFSKGNQASLWSRLSDLSTPVMYVSGLLDKHYTDIGIRLSQTNPAIDHIQIADAGHRVPWEAQSVFVRLVRQMLEAVR